MPSHPLELGARDFAEARKTERARMAQTRRDAAKTTAAALHAARDRLCDYANEIYAGGAAAARRDGEILEEIADRLVAAIQALQPAFDRLEIARDVALFRGPVLSRARSRCDVAPLAALAADCLAEALLSGPAGAVLTAAVDHRSGRICAD